MELFGQPEEVGAGAWFAAQRVEMQPAALRLAGQQRQRTTVHLQHQIVLGSLAVGSSAATRAPCSDSGATA